MSSNVENIVEHLSTIQDVNDFSNLVKDPRLTTLLRENLGNSSTNLEDISVGQSGGFIDPMGFFKGIMDVIFKVIIGVLLFIKGIMTELFWITPWKQGNRAIFWKYVWFCIKCGFYLLVFAVAGPIFIVIGIGMVYSKMFAKMGTDGPTLIRQRLSDARDI
jgi:hypothetical protein